jgi:hypothetical protein
MFVMVGVEKSKDREVLRRRLEEKALADGGGYKKKKATNESVEMWLSPFLAGCFSPFGASWGSRSFGDPFEGTRRTESAGAS